MSSIPPAKGPWWEPTWSRVLGSAGIAFVLVLALLVARVQAGTDPAIPDAAAPAATPDPTRQGATPGFGAPSGSGSVPAAPGFTDPGASGADPPRTHAS